MNGPGSDSALARRLATAVPSRHRALVTDLVRTAVAEAIEAARPGTAAPLDAAAPSPRRDSTRSPRSTCTGG